MLSLLGAATLLPASARALDIARPVRIGVLTGAWGPSPDIEVMIWTLSDLGLVEGEDFVVAVWFTSGDSARLPARAREMVDAGVDIVVPVGPMEADAARNAAPGHPIVFMHIGDPVNQGLVESLARPGGLITGITDRGNAAAARRLELFRDLVPGLRRAATRSRQEIPTMPPNPCSTGRRQGGSGWTWPCGRCLPKPRLSCS